MSVANSRLRAKSGSVVLDSLQDLLPRAIVSHNLYCCPSKHLTGLRAGCSSLLVVAHCITSIISHLQVQRFFQFQCPQFWKFLESAYRDNGEIVGAKFYGLQSRKIGCWIVVREHELK